MTNNNMQMTKYKKAIKFYDFTYEVYLEQINKFDFNKITKYKNSKQIVKNITDDFIIVNELLEKRDVLNAATILRKLYENIIYIIATSFDKSLNVNLNSSIGYFRVVLERNCNELFSENIEKDLFNKVYKYLCKVVHPCSLNEYITYLERYSKYNIYLVNSLKYVMIIIQYIYLDFIYKKCRKEEELNIELLDICTYISLANVGVFITEMSKKKIKRIMKFFCYDINNKYLEENRNDFNYIQKQISDPIFHDNINRIINQIGERIEKSDYILIFKNIFLNKK